MDVFEKKTLKTSRGYTYTYYTSSGDSSRPTLLFQHGWPDNAAMWQKIAGPLRSLNHPIIIPDMLGYDGTDKPTDYEEFKYEFITKDMVDILDAEGSAKCISIGHDWGSTAAGHLYCYFPDRVVGLVNINVTYSPPMRKRLDLETVNAMSEKNFGYPVFAYWHLFTEPDGPALLKDNLDRLFNAMHGEGDAMKRFFCVPRAMRDYLEHKTNPDVSIRAYARDPAFKKAFMDRMSRDGFESPQCWYRATVFGSQYECDKNLPEDRDKVNVPTLFIGCKDDYVCRPEAMYPSIQAGLLPHLEQAELMDAAHWGVYEKPQEIANTLEAWLKKTYGRSGGNL
ncbi:epoxide hydrolase-like protein [Stemphylium lycopersici]|uniref:Epoxide hydrolase-like protein n=1 Tax=Stemphylium lycopersici TaxID=183478 RepID=A0A364N9N9_STELY|nr:epoxide hydrolase [Stemphylium lycopersici]RAR03952.1 epoxide hydrolase-like protein [Stemphylium lycopersici]RAR13883.1 epoxide hydrolase-like protein [Stemphylium lycopersici]